MFAPLTLTVGTSPRIVVRAGQGGALVANLDFANPVYLTGDTATIDLTLPGFGILPAQSTVVLDGTTDVLAFIPAGATPVVVQVIPGASAWTPPPAGSPGGGPILMYVGTPALGTLFYSDSPTATVDQFGNVVPQGINFTAVTGLTNAFSVSDGSGNVLARIDALGNITGQTISANVDLLIGGDSLLNDILPNFAQGVVNTGWAPAAINGGPWPGGGGGITATEAALFELDQILTAGRAYSITIPPCVVRGSVATHEMQFNIRYTTDGTTPTTASTLLTQATAFIGLASPNFSPFNGALAFVYPAVTANYRFLVTGFMNTAAETGDIRFNIFLIIEDIGDATSTNSVNNAAILGTGGTGGAPSTQTYQKTYTPSLWSYYGPDASGTPNGLRSTSTLYQGGESASGGTFNGTQYSFADFSGTSIVADLAGATINSCFITLHCAHSWYDSGMTVQLYLNPNSHGGGSANGFGGQTFHIGEGQTLKYGPGNAYAADFASAAAKSLQFGPGGGYDLTKFGYFSSCTMEINYTK